MIKSSKITFTANVCVKSMKIYIYNNYMGKISYKLPILKIDIIYFETKFHRKVCVI